MVARASRMVCWMEGGTTLGGSGQRREAVERRPRRPLAEATSRTDQQRAAGRG